MQKFLMLRGVASQYGYWKNCEFSENFRNNIQVPDYEKNTLGYQEDQQNFIAGQFVMLSIPGLKIPNVPMVSRLRLKAIDLIS